MASGPITLWQIEGENVEAVTDFIFLGSKIIVAMKLKDACSLEEKAMTNPDSILKNRHHFANKTAAFELWCWRRSNQSILKEITLNIH